MAIVKWKLMEDLWWEFWERESESMLLTVLFLMAYPQPVTHVSLVTGRTRQWPGSDVWQPVGGGRLDNNRLFHYLFQPFPGGWPLTAGHTRDTDISGHYPALISGNGDPGPVTRPLPTPCPIMLSPSHPGLTPSHLSGRLMSTPSWGILSSE